RLFTGESIDRERQELLIALVPHIVRRPEFTEENLKGIAVGTAQTVNLKHGRRASDTPSPAAPTVPPDPRREENPPVPTVANPPAGAVNNAAMPPATAANPATPPATAPSVGAPPATAPPATAPPLTPSGEPATQPDPAKPAGNASVRFLPPSITANKDSNITVALVIENGSEVAAAPIGVKFDPKVLKLIDVGRGDFFSSDGQTPVFTKNIQNEAGTALVNLSRLPQTPGMTGAGILVSLTFQAVGPGTSAVSVPNLTVSNTQGQPVYSGTPQTTVTVR